MEYGLRLILERNVKYADVIGYTEESAGTSLHRCPWPSLGLYTHNTNGHMCCLKLTDIEEVDRYRPNGAIDVVTDAF